MKNLKLGASVLALALASTAFAQTTSNKWLVGVGAHGVNHHAVGKVGRVLENAFSSKELYNVNNFTITPPLSKLTVARNLNRSFVIDWQTTVGNVDNQVVGMGKEFFLQTGLGLQLKIAGLLGNENLWFDPYVRVGANYLRHDYSALGTNINPRRIKADHFTVASGLGANIWLTENFGFGVQGDYVATPSEKTRLANFWQASASLNFRFGNNDKDKDGILDKDDECPEVYGLAQFNGCPDTDGDGIADKEDKCPEVAGPAENGGCPWGDADNDGVLDNVDKCPNVAGPVENGGCPWPDTDGDGILDKDDKCPNVAGLRELDGCPKTPEIYAQDTTAVLKDIFFDFNRATINAQSNAKLDEAAKVIKASNGATFVIVGHTDIKGNENYNLKLSKERAAAVVKALEERGVSVNQLKSTGVGSKDAKYPATATNAEREADRKVVVEHKAGAEFDALPKSDVQKPVKKVSKKRK